MRTISYSEAIAEATVQAMERDPSIFIMGEGVDDAKGIFGTTQKAFARFGSARVFDTPLSENALTGWGTGAALGGMKPLMVHARNDFLLLAMDQIVNHAAKWHYMHGQNVPWTIRGIIGRSWGQAAQHSQALQPLFAYFPGLKVVMPATPDDAKGLLTTSLQDPNPVIFLEHRGLYNVQGSVTSEYYATPLGAAKVRRAGDDVTVIALSQMVQEAERAAVQLEDVGIGVEVVDLRTVRPWDEATVLASVRKTGRVIFCDVGWKQFGISGEIVSTVAEKAFSVLKAAPRRIGLPDCPTPCSYALEEIYYPDHHAIIAAVKQVMPESQREKFDFLPKGKERAAVEFLGPF